MAGFTHFDQNGNAIMVDVTAKADTERIAVATGYIQVNEEVFDAIQNQTAKKGDVAGNSKDCRHYGGKEDLGSDSHVPPTYADQGHGRF